MLQSGMDTPFQKHLQRLPTAEPKKRYKVCERTLRYWKTGVIQPSLQKAKAISKIDGFTMTEIYG